MNMVQSIPNSPRGLLEFTANLLLAHGYIVILIGAAADNFGLPASGDVVLFVGGLFSNQGRLVMVSGFVGALISDNSVYWIGRKGGRPLIHRISKMRFLRFLIDEKSLEKVERYFESHGGKRPSSGASAPVSAA